MRGWGVVLVVVVCAGWVETGGVLCDGNEAVSEGWLGSGCWWRWWSCRFPKTYVPDGDQLAVMGWMDVGRLRERREGKERGRDEKRDGDGINGTACRRNKTWSRQLLRASRINQSPWSTAMAGHVWNSWASIRPRQGRGAGRGGRQITTGRRKRRERAERKGEGKLKEHGEGGGPANHST